jgi:phosphatidate cytidylyltransferase
MTFSRPARRFDWSNLGVRAASAAVLAPIAILSVWFGGPPRPYAWTVAVDPWIFLVVLCAAAILLSIEWSWMSAPRSPRRVSIAISASLILPLLVAASPALHLPIAHPYVCAWAVAAAATVACALIARGVAERPFTTAYGVVYLAPSLIALWWLRQSPEGRGWTTLLLAVTWSADVGAFLVGNWLKGPKLAPQLSPNKTWSGFIGGLVFAVVVGEVVSLISTVKAPVISAGVGLLAGLATMLGDLWESMLKRRFGVKDSGQLIPGHGGLLDRVDGMIFAILVVAGVRLATLVMSS